MEADVCLEDK